MDEKLMESSLWYAVLSKLEKHMSEIAHQMDSIDDLDKDDIYFMGRGVDAISRDIVNSLDKISSAALKAKNLVVSFNMTREMYNEYCRETAEES